MPNPIEQKGIEMLTKLLTKQGRKVLKSDNKTFDLVVNGKYAEVKTKRKPYNKLDFLSFTDRQYKEIRNGNFTVFLVCNIGNPDNLQVYEFKSSKLKNILPKKYTSHEYNKPIIDDIKKIKL